MSDSFPALELGVSSAVNLVPPGGAERFLFDALWQSTAIALAALVLVGIVRRPAPRAWLALLGVVLSIVAPATTLAVRAGNLGWRSPVVEVANVPAAAPLRVPTPIIDLELPQYELAEMFTAPASEPLVPPPAVEPAEHVTLADEYVVADAAIIDREPADAGLAEPRPRDFGRWLLLGWGALSFVCLVRLLRDGLALGRLARSLTPCNDAAILAAVQRAAESIGLRRAPPIATSPRLKSPAIIAWGRGRLLLPSPLPQGVELFAVACHELAHLRRRDGWTRLTVEFCMALLPWQPLLWRLRSAFRRASEEACDDWAVAAGADAVDLADTLTHWLCPSAPTPALGMSESVAVTRRRILRLLAQQQQPRPQLGRWWLSAGLLLALAGGTGMAFWQAPVADVSEEAPAPVPEPVSVEPNEVPAAPSSPEPDATETAADEPPLLDAEPKSADFPESPPREENPQKQIVKEPPAVSDRQRTIAARLEQIKKLQTSNQVAIDALSAQARAELSKEDPGVIDKLMTTNPQYVAKHMTREGYLHELRSAIATTAKRNTPTIKRIEARVAILDVEMEEMRQRFIKETLPVHAALASALQVQDFLASEQARLEAALGKGEGAPRTGDAVDSSRPVARPAPTADLPSPDSPVAIVVNTPAPGLSREQIQAKVSKPIAEALKDLPGVSRILYTEKPDLSLVIVEISPSASDAEVRESIRQCLDRLVLIEGAGTPQIDRPFAGKRPPASRQANILKLHQEYARLTEEIQQLEISKADLEKREEEAKRIVNNPREREGRRGDSINEIANLKRGQIELSDSRDRLWRARAEIRDALIAQYLQAPAKAEEDAPVGHAPYRIEPPDILIIDAVRLARSQPTVARGDKLEINVDGTPPDRPIRGLFNVDQRGRVNLGPQYKLVEVAGLDIDKARDKLQSYLEQIVVNPAVSVEIAEPVGLQPIAGEHLVGPDGWVQLGRYGAVPVNGLTLDEAREAIEKHLEQKGFDATVAVNVRAYNSKVYYVLVNRGEEGDYVVRIPIMGHERVIDALSVTGTTFGADTTVQLRRPRQGDAEQVLDIDLPALLKGDSAATNYRLQPGDRLVIDRPGPARVHLDRAPPGDIQLRPDIPNTY